MPRPMAPAPIMPIVFTSICALPFYFVAPTPAAEKAWRRCRIEFFAGLAVKSAGRGIFRCCRARWERRGRASPCRTVLCRRFLRCAGRIPAVFAGGCRRCPYTYWGGDGRGRRLRSSREGGRRGPGHVGTRRAAGAGRIDIGLAQIAGARDEI